MKLIVSLGNIGDKYKHTRHNIGFMVADKFIGGKKLKFKLSSDYYFLKYKNYVVIKPRTLMNLSGIAVRGAVKRFEPSEILVISDDVNIPFGHIRIRKSGSAGGHNGLKSIIEFLGNTEFARLRFGIGGGDLKGLSGYVLNNFSSKERKYLKGILEFGCDMLDSFIHSEVNGMLNYYSKHKKTYFEQFGLESSIRPKEKKE